MHMVTNVQRILAKYRFCKKLAKKPHARTVEETAPQTHGGGLHATKMEKNMKKWKKWGIVGVLAVALAAPTVGAVGSLVSPPWKENIAHIKGCRGKLSVQRCILAVQIERLEVDREIRDLLQEIVSTIQGNRDGNS